MTRTSIQWIQTHHIAVICWLCNQLQKSDKLRSNIRTVNRMRKSKRRTRVAETLLKYAIITMCGLILFTLANDAANAERISNSVGGEAVFVLLPVLWWIIERTIKDSVAEARKAKRNRNERTWR